MIDFIRPENTTKGRSRKVFLVEHSSAFWHTYCNKHIEPLKMVTWLKLKGYKLWAFLEFYSHLFRLFFWWCYSLILRPELIYISIEGGRQVKVCHDQIT